MDLQHFSHIHPQVFNEEPCHATATCWISGPSFSCMTGGFHLHDKCAEAPTELAHPLHRNHNLRLLTSNPYGSWDCTCNFCDRICENFVYHCSCELDLHIKCALFSYYIAEGRIGELQIAHTDPLISTEIHSESAELKEAVCFACYMPLVDSAYLSLDSGFCLHKKCAELPLEIDHLSHREHSLLLQFTSQSNCLPCQICQKTQNMGFVYSCSICKFVIHIECVSPSPIIENRRLHEHPFSRFFRQVSFICDACGTQGNCISYICSTCSLIVHKKCISLPRLIKSIWHHHPISHKYFVVDNECGTLECGVCHEDVNKVHGSYYCSECKFIVHVDCVLEEIQGVRWYEEIDESSKDAYYEKFNEYQLLAQNDPSFFAIRDISLGENGSFSTEIKHFSHEHNLVSSDEVKDDDETHCDGCSLLITTSFYRCSQCNFFLHKSCVELPKKKLIWFHTDQPPLTLVSNHIFKCDSCKSHCSGFSYICETCWEGFCVHCAGISFSWTSQGHEHPLLVYHTYHGRCNTCGGIFVNEAAFRCKDCDFNVQIPCSLLAQTARHKCDEHLLTLTYDENNDYSEYHYCDICEERRNPSNWFYHCTICSTSAHPRCVLGDYPFVKRGIRTFLESDHRHDLVVVEKVYDYPEACCKCGQPCLDVALECSETRCNYIIHWRCSAITQVC